MTKKNERKFACFILTNGRADNVITYRTLRRQGYTGDIFLIIDNLDSQIEEYKKNFGEEFVIIFDKNKAVEEYQTMNNNPRKNVILYARNESQKIAKDLGYTHMLQLDDDYNRFSFRFPQDEVFKEKGVENLDKLFNAVLDCLDSTGADTIALAQNGDFIGGINNYRYYKRVLRKAMNSFFINVNNPLDFVGCINEDVNTYAYWGSRGKKIFTITEASLHQEQTQQNSGGMSETYLNLGTYEKSFYSVMIMPSAVKVSTMGGGGNEHNYYRIHHHINWNNCTPKIIDQKWKK